MMAEEKGAIPSEEKEVEELARAMCSFSKNTLCRECSDACFYKDFAKRAIDKGWRKQSEGIANNATATDDVVREIFWEIEKYLFYHENIPNTVYKTIDKNIFTRIKKKYTEGGAE